jgi:hypothetical protein|nr:MAG TPA: hypothetical protein [Caudoviricetes sp.]
MDKKVRYKVWKSDGLWEVEWKKGILTTIATFPTFAAAHAYVRERLYGTQDDYSYAC